MAKGEMLTVTKSQEHPASNPSSCSHLNWALLLFVPAVLNGQSQGQALPVVKVASRRQQMLSWLLKPLLVWFLFVTFIFQCRGLHKQRRSF